eukprot:scaffold4856_cov309-Prasinococcus_capsulatus_cf.AAC.1
MPPRLAAQSPGGRGRPQAAGVAYHAAPQREPASRLPPLRARLPPAPLHARPARAAAFGPREVRPNTPSSRLASGAVSVQLRLSGGCAIAGGAGSSSWAKCRGKPSRGTTTTTSA